MSDNFTLSYGSPLDMLFNPPPALPPNRISQSPISEVPPHTRIVFDSVTFPRVVDWAISIAREQRYEALAACGHSGLTVAGAAGYVLRIPVIAVRKSDDDTHDSRTVNAILPKGNVHYAFIDDLISSGKTFYRVVRRIYNRVSEEAVCAGILLYNSHREIGCILKSVQDEYKTDHVFQQACQARIFERPHTRDGEFSD